MRINTPPSPFLDSRDLNSRYASQVRKLSNQPVVMDGDTYFTGVDTFKPPQELPAGVCADAVNKRFEDGRAWPRNGINTQSWGLTGITPTRPATICGYARFNDPQGFDTQVVLTDDWRDQTGEDGGRGRCWKIQSGNAAVPVPMNGHDIWGITRAIACYNGLVLLRQGNERHYFSGSSTLPITSTAHTAGTLSCATELLTNGMACIPAVAMASGMAPYFLNVVSAGKVSLYDTQAHAIAGGATGLIAPSHDGDTGTLKVSGIDGVNSRIRLNTEPSWNDGDLVQFVAEPNAYFLPNAVDGTVPNSTSQYYVKTISDTLIELYTDADLTIKLNFSSAFGSFYLMRNASFPGFYGNGAPPLLAQPNLLGNTLWDVGFKSVPPAVFITTVAGNVITAPNHNLLPADAIAVTGITLSGGGALPATVYANPTSPHTLQVFDTADDALAAGSAGLIALTDVSAPTGATIVKNGASGLPMPSGREGCYLENRLVIINQACTLAISDPLDVLHFTPFTAATTANLGESDNVMALVPLPLLDSLLILKQNEVLLLNNFSQGSDAWTTTTVTREYGCYAPLSAVQVGSDVWFLSRKGVASITQTVNGITQGVAEPVSKPMKKYIDLIDWRNAAQSVAGYWNNRFFLAVPLKGQTGTVQNNGWLVYNFLNQMWEGLWQGSQLIAAGISRHVVFGDERLTFVDPSGQVRWLGDGYTDGATAIGDSLTTRIYICGSMSRKLHLASDLFWDTYMPTLTVMAQTPGVNETEVLQPSIITYDSTKYDVAGVADYVPGVSNFQAPYREDYKMTAAELLSGAPDTHQNRTESFRHRLDDWGIQFVIVNKTGSCRLQGLSVRAVGGPSVDNAQV